MDMNKEQIIKDEMIASKCGWTPFNNYKVKGFPIATIVNGEIVSLTFTEFEILYLLVSHPNWVYTRNQIIDEIVY